jgi:hypothetical protein
MSVRVWTDLFNEIGERTLIEPVTLIEGDKHGVSAKRLQIEQGLFEFGVVEFKFAQRVLDFSPTVMYMNQSRA